ncbi:MULTISPECIES: ABC transporter permease subunit [Clostridium]|uniref:ABC-2 family transporter protein n=2 Tax=Clostridium TaxID=1485 RepID=D8GIV3_CLOLD|nr:MULTISPECIES: ABC transporter permease subunit [Clostridium]ADK15028.1 putative ABC transporter related membrane protein [Clostridium ljungdahlii DSM 13528]AGY74280.1 ABC transporter permease [Clostridium autoethanogenum DSM 10061]ALU34471.1 ABC-type transporter-like membrane protein [Clostridium autoethanogenum DSM 10061]OAA87689.1 ABC-2 family transporter protein [Clostridium ljungdahlii DSM 13528]OVY51191.1 ABC-2 family transporter protein [Clostridium autoethanogenum]
MIFPIIKNEIIKIFYRKKFLICSIILLLVAAFSVLAVNSENGERGLRKDKSIEQYYKDQKKLVKDKAKIAEIQTHIDNVDKMVKDYEFQKTHPLAWKDTLKKDVKLMESVNDSKLDDAKKEQRKSEITYKKYLLENNIKPVSSIKATGYVLFNDYSLILDYGMIVIFLVAVFMTVDSVSSEYAPPTLKLLLLRPVTKTKLLLGKFLACAISSSALVVIFNLIFFLFGEIVYGFDSFKYPVSIGPEFKHSSIQNMDLHKFISVIPGTSSIMPLYKFLIEFMILQIIFIIAATSFCILISTLIKSNAAATSTAILFGVAYMILSKIPALSDKSDIMPAFFIALGSSVSIITRRIVQDTGAYYINTLSASLIMIAWSILFLGLSTIIVEKREEYI